jgi:hypothetical protein
MLYEDVTDLTSKLQALQSKEATRQLCSFFVECRFNDENFNDNFIDASKDGGIDYFYSSNDQFYIVQSKYNSKNSVVSFDNIQTEIDKILETIDHPTNERLKNKYGNDFVNKVRANLTNPKAIIDIYYLTTGRIEETTVKECDEYLSKRINEKEWKIRFSFNPADYRFLETMIVNNRFGFIPYTGKKEIEFDNKIFFEVSISNIDSLVGVVPISQLIDWFENRKEIKKFLQKNVRGYLEKKRENKIIKKSYLDDPQHFWFKHNGIVIFVDHYDFDQANKNRVLLSNPQIVNGGQTINSIYSAFSETDIKNEARVVLRIIKLPYDRIESYQKGLEIIEGLNTQVKIKASDLRSNDERQVQIERIVERINAGYAYVRKRESGVHVADTVVVMEQLANLINCCVLERPNEAIRMEVEKLFRDKYDKIFDKNKILIEFAKNTEVYNYLVIWRIHRLLVKVKKQLAMRYQNLFYATQFYVLLDIYKKLAKLRNHIKQPQKIWFDFVESNYFQEAVRKYAKLVFPRTYDLIPVSERSNPDRFFKQIRTVSVAEQKLGLAKDFNRLFQEAYALFEQEFLNI